MTIASIKWTLILKIISQRDVEHILTLLIKIITVNTSFWRSQLNIISSISQFVLSNIIAILVIISVSGLSIFFKSTSTFLYFTSYRRYLLLKFEKCSWIIQHFKIGRYQRPFKAGKSTWYHPLLKRLLSRSAFILFLLLDKTNMRLKSMHVLRFFYALFLMFL